MKALCPWLIAAALVLGASISAQSTAPKSQKGAQIPAGVSEWLRLSQRRAYDALFPIDLPGLRAAYRTDPGNDPDEPERYFEIHLENQFPLFAATVIVPQVDSITRQLATLRQRDYRASFEQILVNVAVQRIKMDSFGCPGIQSQLGALWKLPVSLQHDENIIRLDATVHQIVVWNSAGRLNAEIDDDDHALVLWAEETFDALVVCGKRLGLDARKPYASRRLAAIEFAITRGFGFLEEKLVVADETPDGQINPDSSAIARLLGPAVKTGAWRDWLRCDQVGCYAIADNHVLVVDELKDNDSAIRIRQYWPNWAAAGSHVLYEAVVKTERLRDGWIGTRYRDRPKPTVTKRTP